jgi:molybdopterin-guanine dinucleotide biosynthesis protein A
MRPAGLVLAGGRSSRFGAEKAAAILEGRPLLAHAHAALAPHCAAVAVSAQPGSQAEAIAHGLGLPVLPDEPGHPRGTLAGVVAGLAWAEAQGAAVLAVAPCDTPRMGADAVARLIAALGPDDDIAAAVAGDRLHALCAVLRAAAMRPLAALLDRGEHPPMQALWRSLRLREVRFDDEGRFTNVNRPGDLDGLAAPPAGRPV